jgi:Cu-Zn family superoxide dismutase
MFFELPLWIRERTRRLKQPSSPLGIELAAVADRGRERGMTRNAITVSRRLRAGISGLALLGAAMACSADTTATSGEATALSSSEPRAIPHTAAPAADAPVQHPSSLAPLPTATLAARAELAPTAGNEAHGVVEFYLAEPSMVLYVELAGVKPGMHGFHVHEKGSCDGPNAGGAGNHLNPLDARHGDPQDADRRRHAGDLGNVRAEDDGTVKQWLRTRNLQLQGPAGILGKAILLHAREDDLESQPGGNSGDAIACGLIDPFDS